MENLPVYISVVFILTTIITLLLLYKATHYSKSVIIGMLLWLAAQAIIGLSGFYKVTTGIPPRFGLLLFPPLIFITIFFISKKGRQAADGFDIKLLTLLHIVRIPVELTLYWLYLHHAVPQLITFEGRNFDILCGITAPLVYYFDYVKNVLGRRVLLAWNIACLLLLANVVITAVLSAPFPFQKFGFGQPNIALFYFPFVWLPCFVVPAVLFAHVASTRRLLNKHS